MNDADEDNTLDDTPDAITLLTADHEDVRQLFADYDELVAGDAPAEDRLALATEICNALTAHATAEEELFYPAVRGALGDGEVVDEAENDPNHQCPPGCPTCHHVHFSGASLPATVSLPVTWVPMSQGHVTEWMPSAYAPAGPELPSVFRPPKA